MKFLKNLSRRGLALFLVLTMCMSLLPTTAMAAEWTEDEDADALVQETQVSNEIPAEVQALLDAVAGMEAAHADFLAATDGVTEVTQEAFDAEYAAMMASSDAVMEAYDALPVEYVDDPMVNEALASYQEIAEAWTGEVGLLNILPENTKVVTFQFFTDEEGTQAYGEPQILKADEALQIPAAPEKTDNEDGSHNVFKQWINKTTGEAVVEHAIVAAEAEGNPTVEVVPQFEQYWHVTFMSYAAEGETATECYRAEVKCGEAISEEDLTAAAKAYVPSDAGKTVGSWSYTDVNGNAVTLETNVPTTDLIATAIEADGVWVEFDSNGGTPVNAVYPNADGFLMELPTTTRPGYTFLGWLTEDNQAFTTETKVEKLTKVTAVWEANDGSYTVQFWVENADNDEYSYVASETVSTGVKVGDILGSDDEGWAAKLDAKLTREDDRGQFAYSREETVKHNPGLGEGKMTVEGDGSTILKLYFTRARYWLTFKDSGGTTTEKLICTKKLHSHSVSNDCYALSCGKTGQDYEWVLKRFGLALIPVRVPHEHTQSCYDRTTPICGIEEHPNHTSACYQTVSTATTYYNKLVKYDADLNDVWTNDSVKKSKYVSWQSSLSVYKYSYLAKMPNSNLTLTGYDKNTGYTWYYWLEALDGGIPSVESSLDGKVLPYSQTGGVESGDSRKYYAWYASESGLSGLYLTYDEDYFPITGFTQKVSKGVSGEGWKGDQMRDWKNKTRNLYYIRNTNQLELNNGAGQKFFIEKVPYNTPLLSKLRNPDSTWYKPDGLTPPAGKEGYTFGGWSMSPNSKDVVPGTERMPDGEQIVYAIWLSGESSLTVNDSKAYGGTYGPITIEGKATVSNKAELIKLLADHGVTVAEPEKILGFFQGSNAIAYPFTIEGSVTLTVSRQGETAQVTYKDGKGNVLDLDGEQYPIGLKAVVKSTNDPNFDHWEIEGDETHTAYYPGRLVEVVRGGVTLVAKYEDVNNEPTSVVFDANGGTVKTPVSGANLSVNGNSITQSGIANNGSFTVLDFDTYFTAPQGKKFAGWYDAQTGGTKYMPNVAYRVDRLGTQPGANTLYAIYEDVQYTVKYDLGYTTTNTVAPKDNVKWSDTGLLPTPNPTRNGFKFLGWYDAAETNPADTTRAKVEDATTFGSIASKAGRLTDTSLPEGENPYITLYAGWEEIAPKIPTEGGVVKAAKNDKGENLAEVKYGDVITYTVTITPDTEDVDDVHGFVKHIQITDAKLDAGSITTVQVGTQQPFTSGHGFTAATKTEGEGDSKTNVTTITLDEAVDQKIVVTYTYEVTAETPVEDGKEGTADAGKKFITNTAKVKAWNEDENKPGSGEDDNNVELKPSVTVEKFITKVGDKTFTKDSQPDNSFKAYAGETIQWTITVTNSGLTKAENVVVTDTFKVEKDGKPVTPVGTLKIVDKDGTEVQLGENGKFIISEIGAATTENETVKPTVLTYIATYDVRPEDKGATISNVAAAEGQEPDPEKPEPPTIPVSDKDAIEVVKKAYNKDGNEINGAVPVGTEIKYEITVTNNGNVAYTAENPLTITDKLTASYVKDGATVEEAREPASYGTSDDYSHSHDNGTTIFTVTNLPVKAEGTTTDSSVKITYTYLVGGTEDQPIADAGKKLTNVAVQGSDPDTEPSDDVTIEVKHVIKDTKKTLVSKTGEIPTGLHVNVSTSDDGTIVVGKDVKSITLLYKISVTGDAGAEFVITDEGATYAGAFCTDVAAEALQVTANTTDSTITGTIPGNPGEEKTVDVYVTMPFDVIRTTDETTGKTTVTIENRDNAGTGLTNQAEVKGKDEGTTTKDPDPKPEGKSYTVTVNYVKDTDKTALKDAYVVILPEDNTGYSVTIPHALTEGEDEAAEQYALDTITVGDSTPELVAGAEDDAIKSSKDKLEKNLDIIAVYSVDKVDEDHPGTPGSDGIPDKYQVTFEFTAAANGKVEPASLVKTLVDNKGNFLKTSTVSITAEDNVKASGYTGYAFDKWTSKEFASFTYGQAALVASELSVEGGNTYHFQASFKNNQEYPYTIQYHFINAKGEKLSKAYTEFIVDSLKLPTSGEAPFESIVLLGIPESAGGFILDAVTGATKASEGANAGKYGFVVSNKASENVIDVYYDVDNWNDKANTETGGDGIPDKYQVLVKYEVAKDTGTGSVAPAVEVHTLKKADGETYTYTGSVEIGSTATPESGSAFAYWTDPDGKQSYSAELTGNKSVEGGETYIYTATFKADTKGGTEPGTGDGTPDEYQVFVAFAADGNGQVVLNPVNAVLKYDLYQKENGAYTTEDGALIPEDPIQLGVTATAEKKADAKVAFDRWELTSDKADGVLKTIYANATLNSNRDLTDDVASLTAGATYTYTAKFEKDEIGENGGTDGGDGIPDKYQVTFTYVAGEGGTVTGIITEVVTRPKKADGSYDEIAPVHPRAEVAVKANSGYTFSKWAVGTDPRFTYEDETAIRNALFSKDTTFTAKFENTKHDFTVKYMLDRKDQAEGEDDGVFKAVTIPGMLAYGETYDRNDLAFETFDFENVHYVLVGDSGNVTGTATGDVVVEFYYSKDEIGTEDPAKPDGTADRDQITFTYVAEEHGSFGDGVKEVNKVVTKEGNLAYPAGMPTPVADSGYAFDFWKVQGSSMKDFSAELADLKEVQFRNDTTFVAYFAKDEIGGTNPDDPKYPGDGIPDKYQVTVKYVAVPDEFGSIKDREKAEEVLTIYERNADGALKLNTVGEKMYAETGMVEISGSVAVAKETGVFQGWTVPAGTHYLYTEFTNITDEGYLAAGNLSGIKGEGVYTFTAEFTPKDAKVTYPEFQPDPTDPENPKPSGMPEEKTDDVASSTIIIVDPNGGKWTAPAGAEWPEQADKTYKHIAEPNEQITLDNPQKDGFAFVGWVRTETTGTDDKGNTVAIITYTAQWSPDTYKPGEDNKKTDESDGTPDVFQAVVTYKVVSGTWNDSTTTEKQYVFDLWKKDDATGKWSKVDPAPTLGTTIPTDMKANDHFTDGSWNTVIGKDTVVSADVTYTYTFSPVGQRIVTVNLVYGDTVLSSTPYNVYINDPFAVTETMAKANLIVGGVDYIRMDESLPSIGSVTKNETLTVRYDRDVQKDPTKPTQPGEGGGDGIPDRYQITVNYAAVNGTVTPASTVVTKLDANRNPSENGVARLEAAHIPTTEPNAGYGNGTWDKVPEIGLVVTDRETITITYTATVTPPTPIIPGPVTPGTTIPTGPVPLGPGGTTIGDNDVPLAAPGLNSTDHFDYIKGYDDGTVKPEAAITRAEVATIFFRLMTNEFRTENWATENSFSDVKTGEWWNNAISTAAKANILTGYPEGDFRPDNKITRAEFATIAARFASDIEVTQRGRFSDIQSHWAEENIERAAAAGWIKGENGKFRPEDPITRAEVITVVNRMLDRVPDKDHLLPDMKTFVDNMDVDEWYYADIQEATNSHDYERAEDGVTGIWTELLPAQDWTALEKEWATAADANVANVATGLTGGDTSNGEGEGEDETTGDGEE